MNGSSRVLRFMDGGSVARACALLLAGFGLLWPSRAMARQEAGFRLGPALGAAGVTVQRSDWTVGPMFGGRVAWTGGSSGAALALDVQPFATPGRDPAGDYRAIYVLPSYQRRAGVAGFGVGVGLAMLRFEDEAVFGGRTDVTTVTSATGAVRLPRSLTLELGWRRTNLVRGFRSNVWSLQLVRTWRLGL